MIDKNEFWLLTSKYLSGEISEVEKNRLFGMMERDSSLRDELEDAKKIWHQTADIRPEHSHSLLQRTHEKISDYEAGKLQAPELPPYETSIETPLYSLPHDSKSTSKKWIAAAAVFIGVSLFSHWLFQKTPTNNTPLQWTSVDVLPGQQRKIILADSSVVYINAGSHIEYPLSFTDSIREIRLEGEAFFQVTKNARQPFVVHSGALRTRVLGTSFNVRAYQNEEIQSVLVATGKVQVTTKESVSDILLPNHLLTYHVQEKRSAVTNQLYETTDWQQNRMAFNDISFKDLAAELGRRYRKTLVFNNPEMKTCRYRAVFKDLPLEKILQQLSLTNGFSYTSKGDTIYLKGKSCE